MQGPNQYAVAVRRQNGSILLQKQSMYSWTRRYPLLGWPLIRGSVKLLESLVLGMRMLTFSANAAVEEEEGEELSRGQVFLAMLAGIVITLVFFVGIPVLVSHWSMPFTGRVGRNLIEALLRFGLFLGYIVAISRIEDIRRVFAYHGAEHKVIHTLEAGKELTAQSARVFSRLHPRCGTSFILMVFLLAMVVYSVIDTPSLTGRFLIRILLLPLLAGLGYELLKWSSRYTESLPVRILIAPGLWLQKITTREPDDGQLEVAIAALRAVLPQAAPDSVESIAFGGQNDGPYAGFVSYSAGVDAGSGNPGNTGR